MSFVIRRFPSQLNSLPESTCLLPSDTCETRAMCTCCRQQDRSKDSLPLCLLEGHIVSVICVSVFISNISNLR